MRVVHTTFLTAGRDAVYDHILHMSDALTDGIVKQFPDKLGTGVVSTTGKR